MKTKRSQKEKSKCRMQPKIKLKKKKQIYIKKKKTLEMGVEGAVVVGTLCCALSWAFPGFQGKA